MNASLSSAVAIQPGTLFSLAGSSPVALPLLTTDTAGAGRSLLDSASSIVQVSGLGQVLAAGSTLESRLQTLQASLSEAASGSTLAETADFVSAFNGLQESINSVQPLLGTLPDSALLARFSLTLNAAATAAVSGVNLNLGSLQSIGIGSSASLSSATAEPVVKLNIDQHVLNEAIAANPGGVLGLLAQATQPLLQQVAAFTAQATTSSGLPSDLSVLGSGVSTRLLQNLAADTVLNDIELNDLDLAAVGLSADTIQLINTVLEGSLSATFLAAEATTNLPVATLAFPRTGIPASTAGRAAASAALATLPEIAVSPPSPTLAVASQNSLAVPSGVAADATAAGEAASAATLALQRLVDDPALRALNNNLFNPVYSALMAAAHQNDFTASNALLRSSAPTADSPAPVLPVALTPGVNSDHQAARGFAPGQSGVNGG